MFKIVAAWPLKYLYDSNLAPLVSALHTVKFPIKMSYLELLKWNNLLIHKFSFFAKEASPEAR